jgi:hypothetical protein
MSWPQPDQGRAVRNAGVRRCAEAEIKDMLELAYPDDIAAKG